MRAVKLDFRINEPPCGGSGGAKLERGKRKADEETREMGAPGLLIERHPLLQKGPELCEKTTKTPFSLQKAIRQNAQVVRAKGVGDLPGANYAKNGPPRLQKEGTDQRAEG